MLLNWFVSSAEANSTRNISNSQELRTLGIQYCTHLLAAGVLRQISDKEAPTEKVFKPNLMYYWAHMEPTVAQPLTPGRLHTTTWPPQKETYQSQQYYSVNNNEEITDITEAKLIIADLKRKLQDLVHQLENYKENSIGVINNKNLNGNKSLQVVERQKLELISREVQTNNISNDNSHMSDKSVITTSKPDSILKTNVDNGLNVELSKFNYDERCTHAIKEEPEQRSVKIENYCKLNKSRECNLSLRKDTSLEHIEKRINSDIVTNKLEKQHINETQKNNRLSNNIQNFVSDSSSDASYVSTTTDVMGNQSMMGDDRIPFRSLSPPTSQVLYAKPDNYQFASNLSSLELTQSEQSWKSIESEKSEASSDLISENVTTIDIEAEQSLPKLESPSIKQSELEMKIYIPKEISGTVEKLESPTTVSPSSLVPLDTSSKPFTTTVVRSQPPPMPGMSPSPPPTPGTNQSTTLCRIHANELVKYSSMKESLASTVSEGPPNISLLPDIATFEDQQPTLPPIPTTHIPLPPSLQSDVNATSPPTMSSMEAIPPPPPMLPMEPTSQNTPNLGPSPPPMSSIGIPSSSMSSMGPPPPPMPGMGPPPPPMPGMGPPPPPPPMPGMGPPPPPMPGMGPPPPPPMPGMGPPPMPGMGPPPPPPMPGMGPPPPPPMPGMGPPPPPPMPGMGPPPPPMPGMGPPPPPMPGMGPPPPPLPGMGPPPPPPILGMGPPPPPMAGFGPPPPPIPGVSAPGIPPTPSGPTPFPAPPVGGWSMQRATLRKPPIKPAAPMKPLYWTRILATTSIRTGQGEADTGFKPLWLEIDETRLDNIDEFMDLFSRQVVKAPVKKKVEVKTKIQPIKILDSKRSQNVGILAQSLHIEFSEIENAIYNFDTSVVSLEALQQIYELRATSEELAMIKEHLKSKSDIPLDKPEAFLHDLSGIPNFAERISCFMFQAEFEDAVNTTMHKLDNLKHTCEFLMNNESLKQLFAIILTLGNYMNGGNGQRGQADGFGLEILSKLKDVKSKQSTVTLLHFIVKTYMRQRGGALSEECALPVPEPGDVLRAAALDFADVAAGLATLRAQLEGCKEKMKKVVEAGSTSNHPDVAVGPENNKRMEVFKDKMTTFIDAAEEKLKTEDENLSECRNKFISTVRFYQYTPKCGKVEDCEPKEFFSLWTSFCSDFKDIYKKEEQLAVKEKLKETKKLHEVRKAQTVTQPKKEGGLKARLQKLSSVRK